MVDSSDHRTRSRLRGVCFGASLMIINAVAVGGLFQPSSAKAQPSDDRQPRQMRPAFEPEGRGQNDVRPTMRLGAVKFDDLSGDGQTRDHFLGEAWLVQTPRVQSGSDGSRRMAARGGQNASFDTPKKIRSELVGQRRFQKGELIQLEGELFVEPGAPVDWAQWLSLLQVHQADSRYEDGRPVNASPPFSAGLAVVDGVEQLQVRGETSPPGDILRDGPPGAYTYRFATERILGRTPIKRGVWLPFQLRMIDSHGEPGGLIYFKLGDVVVADFKGPVGYGYVDTLAVTPYGGKPQPTGSYLKLGVYGGNSALAAIPRKQGVAVRFRPSQ